MGEQSRPQSAYITGLEPPEMTALEHDAYKRGLADAEVYFLAERERLRAGAKGMAEHIREQQAEIERLRADLATWCRIWNDAVLAYKHCGMGRQCLARGHSSP